MASFAVNGQNNLSVGIPFLQKTRSYLWGFLAGEGWQNAIGSDKPSGAPYPYLQHTTSDLRNGTPGAGEPRIGFYNLLGSYFVDWNMTNDFMRASIAGTTYGLAATWTGHFQTAWQFHGMGLGESLGECVLTTVNNPIHGDQQRWMTVIGDPTLRLNMFTPPTALSAVLTNGNVRLTWTSGEPAASYLIYRGSSVSGPFIRVPVDPVTNSTQIVQDVSTNRVYMVRGARAYTTGSGSYTNLSLGSIATAQP